MVIWNNSDNNNNKYNNNNNRIIILIIVLTKIMIIVLILQLKIKDFFLIISHQVIKEQKEVIKFLNF